MRGNSPAAEGQFQVPDGLGVGASVGGVVTTASVGAGAGAGCQFTRTLIGYPPPPPMCTTTDPPVCCAAESNVTPIVTDAPAARSPDDGLRVTSGEPAPVTHACHCTSLPDADTVIWAACVGSDTVIGDVSPVSAPGGGNDGDHDTDTEGDEDGDAAGDPAGGSSSPVPDNTGSLLRTLSFGRLTLAISRADGSEIGTAPSTDAAGAGAPAVPNAGAPAWAGARVTTVAVTTATPTVPAVAMAATFAPGMASAFATGP